MRSNPSDPTMAKRVYANSQINEVLDITKFAEHISSHHSKYSKADITAVIIELVTCMREQLLNGNKINLGDLGSFTISLSSYGAKDYDSFNAATNIRGVKIRFIPGAVLKTLKDDAKFERVLTKEEEAKARKKCMVTN